MWYDFQLCSALYYLCTQATYTDYYNPDTNEMVGSILALKKWAKLYKRFCQTSKKEYIRFLQVSIYAPFWIYVQKLLN